MCPVQSSALGGELCLRNWGARWASALTTKTLPLLSTWLQMKPSPILFLCNGGLEKGKHCRNMICYQQFFLPS